MLVNFKKDYDRNQDQNNVTIIGEGMDNSLYSLILEVISNILSKMKQTIFPITLECINYILLGNFGDYQDIISYSISILFINIIGLSFGIGIIDSLNEIEMNIMPNLHQIKENPNTIILYYDCTKFYIYITFMVLSVFSYFSSSFLFLLHFNDEIIDKATLLIQISIFSNFFILMHFFNLKILKISNQFKVCDKVNILTIVLHFTFSIMLFYIIKDKIFALGISILISSFFMFIFSSFFVDEYSVVKPTLFSFKFNSLSNFGITFYKNATYNGLINLINYLFFAVFILLSIHLKDFEFAINSIIGNFMKMFFSVTVAIGLSYIHFHNSQNSNSFIQNHSRVFNYVVASMIILLSILFFFIHSSLCNIYTSDYIIMTGVESVVMLYPFFFCLECIICIFEQATISRKKMHIKFNPYSVIFNLIAILIFYPITSLFAFYWEFNYSGIWICYFEFLVFKFIVYLIILIFEL